MFKQTTVIAFDLDDTLWPCMPTLLRAEEILYQWLARNYPRITERYDPEDMVALRRQFSSRDRRYTIDMTAMRTDFLRHLGDSHDYDGADLATQGFEVFFHARQQVEFFDDVLPCLERLQRRFRLGAISNGNASVEHVGLAHLFEHAVSASDVQAAKPDPQIYDHFAARFEVEPGQIVYVGDHPDYDVEGSRQAGYRAIWINRDRADWPAHLVEPEYQVADLHELEALLTA